MPDQATERTTIDAAPDRVFDVAIDIDKYPEWARDVKEAVVAERDERRRLQRQQDQQEAHALPRRRGGNVPERTAHSPHRPSP